MAKQVNTYNNAQVFVTYAGRRIEGRVNGAFVSTKFSTAKASKQVGAGGDVTVSVSQDRSGEITLTVMQQSTSHRFLTELSAVDRATGTLGIAPFEIRDLSGGLLESAEQAWLAEEPENGYAAESGERVWKLECAELVRSTLAAGG